MFPPLISKALPSISVDPAVNLPCNAKALIFVASNVGVDNTLVLASYAKLPSAANTQPVPV